MRTADVQIYRTKPALPAESGMLELEGSAVITSVRQVSETTEVRMFNPQTKKISATLRLKGALKNRKAQRVDCEGNALGSVDAVKGAVALSLKPKQILTLSFR